MASSIEDQLEHSLDKWDPIAHSEPHAESGQNLSQQEDKVEGENESCASTKHEHVNPELHDPDWVEERFRIDRKKLETMLHTPPDEHGMTGEEFFEKVMIETDTQIKWPSKLKIGAKSKKDPHVKVEGKRQNVMKAKKKILDLLETKVNKVTLKIDVTHTEHSHVIGKGGGNIKKVMEVTACHIHFPDSNRYNASGEKSNQVSIAGPVEGVESARRQIRDLQPLVLTFDLPMALAPHSVLEVTSPVVQHVAQAFGVSVSFQQQPKFYSCSCMVRGLQGNCASVKKATCVLMDLLLGAENHATVSTQLDIGSHQHLLLLGHGGTSFLSVMHLTHTQIILPDLSAHQSTPSLLIQGAPDGVCLARQQLLDCLPVCLMFDMRENGKVEPCKLAQIMQNLGVFISIKPKVKQTVKSVVVKTLERNVGNLYEARRLLLGLEASEVTSSNMKPICEVPLSSLNNHWLNMMMQQLHLLDPIVASAPEGMVGTPLHEKARPSPPPGLSVVHEKRGNLLKGADPKQAKTSEEKDHWSSVPGTPSPEGQGSDVRAKTPASRRNSQSEVMKDQQQEENAVVSQQVASQITCRQVVNAEENSISKERTTEDIMQKVSESISSKDCDYEKKKLLATRAMQKKPVETEVRTPTDTWSGLGFSKSMPAEAIKELRSVSHRNYRSYLGTSSIQTWAPQSIRDRQHSGSNSDNWRERRASTPPSSPVLPSSCSYSSASTQLLPSRRSDKTLENYLSCSNYFEGISTSSRAEKPPDDLPELFSQLGLSKYIDIFQQQEIDFQTFLTLSDADLKEVGVSTFGARRKMLLAISDLNKNKKKPMDLPTVKSGYLEGGASGRLPRIMDMDLASQSSRW